MTKTTRRGSACQPRPTRATRAAMHSKRQIELEDLVVPPPPLAPSSAAVAKTLNRLALALGAAFEELSKLRHEIGVAERMEPTRRTAE